MKKKLKKIMIAAAAVSLLSLPINAGCYAGEKTKLSVPERAEIIRNNEQCVAEIDNIGYIIYCFRNGYKPKLRYVLQAEAAGFDIKSLEIYIKIIEPTLKES